MIRHAVILASTAVAVVLTASAALGDVTSKDKADTTADAGLPREADGRSASLLSAFFGLPIMMGAGRLVRRV